MMFPSAPRPTGVANSVLVGSVCWVCDGLQTCRVTPGREHAAVTWSCGPCDVAWDAPGTRLPEPEPAA